MARWYGPAVTGTEERDATPVKLIIWDLDDTLWQGTLSEGPVELSPHRSDQLRRLVDRGVMNAISSRNDQDAAQARLESANLWGLFVFPRINWEAKGAQIRDLIEAAQLRPVNVLFVDDNHLNRAEAEAIVPGLRTADPEEPGFEARIVSIIAGGRDDPGHRRLHDYRLLESRATAASTFADNQQFLRSSGIRVELRRRPAVDAERIHELLIRTNQLNYTKRRVDRTELDALLADPSVGSTAVRVHDRFGDYGLVGFAAVRDGVVEHLAFSCRILGMGVERAVFDWLGRPTVEIAEPVVASLEGPPIDWLELVEVDGTDPASTNVGDDPATVRTSAPRILFVGGCDMESLLPFLGGAVEITTHFNYSPPTHPRLIVHRDSIDYLLMDDVSAHDRDAIVADVPFIDQAAMQPPDLMGVDYVVYSPLIDYIQAKYVRAAIPGVYVSYGDIETPTFDETRIALLAARSGVDSAAIEAFAERWHAVEKPDEVWRAQLRRWFERARGTKGMIVLLGVEHTHDALDEERLEMHRHANGVIRDIAAEFPYVETLEVDPLVRSRADFTNAIRHYGRRVYHDLAREIADRIAALEIMDESAGERSAVSPTPAWRRYARRVKRRAKTALGRA